MIIWIHKINNEIYTETIKWMRQNAKWIPVPGVCYSSMFRVYGCVSHCVFCSISLLFAYMYMRMPSSPRSISGVPSGRALEASLLLTSPVYVPAASALGGLAEWQHNNNNNKKNHDGKAIFIWMQKQKTVMFENGQKMSVGSVYLRYGGLQRRGG